MMLFHIETGRGGRVDSYTSKIPELRSVNIPSTGSSTYLETLTGRLKYKNKQARVKARLYVWFGLVLKLRGLAIYRSAAGAGASALLGPGGGPSAPGRLGAEPPGQAGHGPGGPMAALQLRVPCTAGSTLVAPLHWGTGPLGSLPPLSPPQQAAEDKGRELLSRAESPRGSLDVAADAGTSKDARLASCYPPPVPVPPGWRRSLVQGRIVYFR
ncbi:hypothetical protein HPB47_007435 [Ixodes persulcatus]|uniref:Uncharacterized protein n=1 Tax=Ixodes persulcatus TaxID=34615 RepID=A0AC60P7G4_IXOPE|nr:hypothetical protein HPB47_007435 [Ixodes persulcatus]